MHALIVRIYSFLDFRALGMSTVVKITLQKWFLLVVIRIKFWLIWPWNWRFDLEDDMESWENTRNGFSSQNYTKKEVLHFFLGQLVRNIIYDLENLIFAYLTLIFTFWPWGWSLIIKIVPQLNLQSKTHQKEVLHLLVFPFVENNISQFWPLNWPFDLVNKLESLK